MADTKTKTELEMQDFSWKNIGAWVVIVALIGVAYKFGKKK